MSAALTPLTGHTSTTPPELEAALKFQDDVWRRRTAVAVDAAVAKERARCIAEAEATVRRTVDRALGAAEKEYRRQADARLSAAVEAAVTKAQKASDMRFERETAKLKRSLQDRLAAQASLNASSLTHQTRQHEAVVANLQDQLEAAHRSVDGLRHQLDAAVHARDSAAAQTAAVQSARSQDSVRAKEALAHAENDHRRLIRATLNQLTHVVRARLSPAQQSPPSSSASATAGDDAGRDSPSLPAWVVVQVDGVATEISNVSDRLALARLEAQKERFDRLLDERLAAATRIHTAELQRVVSELKNESVTREAAHQAAVASLQSDHEDTLRRWQEEAAVLLQVETRRVADECTRAASTARAGALSRWQQQLHDEVLRVRRKAAVDVQDKVDIALSSARAEFEQAVLELRDAAAQESQSKLRALDELWKRRMDATLAGRPTTHHTALHHHHHHDHLAVLATALSPQQQEQQDAAVPPPPPVVASLLSELPDTPALQRPGHAAAAHSNGGSSLSVPPGPGPAATPSLSTFDPSLSCVSVSSASVSMSAAPVVTVPVGPSHHRQPYTHPPPSSQPPAIHRIGVQHVKHSPHRFREVVETQPLTSTPARPADPLPARRAGPDVPRAPTELNHEEHDDSAASTQNGASPLTNPGHIT